MLYSKFLENNNKSISKIKKYSFIFTGIYLIISALLVVFSSRETKVLFTVIFVIITVLFFTYLLSNLVFGISTLRKMNDKVEKNIRGKQEIKTVKYLGNKSNSIDDDQTVILAYDFLESDQPLTLYSYIDLPIKKDSSYEISFRSLFVLEVGNLNE